MASITHTPQAQADLNTGISREQVLGRLSAFLLIGILIIAGLAQAENMFQFPYYQDAEGTNIANTWSVLNGGDLSPYTYAYEDPPTGRFILGAWTLLTGGFSQFGFVLDSGRVLMLGLHLLSVAFVYGITRKLSNSTLAAILAAVVFAFSPLVTSIQRRVLLDNIMLVFLLGAFYLSIGKERTLYHYLLAAIAFGMAFLIKTDALWFLIPMLFTIRITSHPQHRRFAHTIFLTMSILLMSLYALYAQMRLELFPEGFFLGGDFPHVSLIESMMDRGPDTGVFLNIASGLGNGIDQWTNVSNITADPIIVFAGAIAIVFTMILSVDNKGLRPLVAMVLGFAGAMLFGGQVFPADVIMVLPFFAAAIGIVAAAIASAATVITENGVFKLLLTLLTLGIVLYPFWTFYSARLEIYTVNQVDGQLEAINWVERNLPQDALVVTDNYAWVTLRGEMPNVHHYWKVDTDPDVKFTLLNDNHCSIDYLITTPQVLSDIDGFNMDLMRRAYNSSELLMSYENNGWPVQVWQVSKQNCPIIEQDA